MAAETVSRALSGRVEALLMASPRPLSLGRLRSLIEDAAAAEVQRAIEDLNRAYEETGRAFSIQELAGGFVLSTRPEFAEDVVRLEKSRTSHRLSTAALETLAIVAYRQPVLRADVEAIRGVQSGQLLRGLMESDLVRVVGRADVPGQPLLYGTTEKFLELFGLKSLEDLPKPEEV